METLPLPSCLSFSNDKCISKLLQDSTKVSPAVTADTCSPVLYLKQQNKRLAKKQKKILKNELQDKEFSVRISSSIAGQEEAKITMKKKKTGLIDERESSPFSWYLSRIKNKHCSSTRSGCTFPLLRDCPPLLSLCYLRSILTLPDFFSLLHSLSFCF